MNKIYDVEVTWSGYMLGKAVYTVLADSEEEAEKLAILRNGARISHTITEDDTEVLQVNSVKFIQEDC